MFSGLGGGSASASVCSRGANTLKHRAVGRFDHRFVDGGWSGRVKSCLSASLRWPRSRVSGSSPRAPGFRARAASPRTGPEESRCRANGIGEVKNVFTVPLAVAPELGEGQVVGIEGEEGGGGGEGRERGWTLRIQREGGGEDGPRARSDSEHRGGDVRRHKAGALASDR